MQAAAAARALEKDERTLIDRILEAIQLGQVIVLFEEASALLQAIAEAGAVAAFEQMEIIADARMFELVNEFTVQYARTRGAEMVGRKWVDGELIENPNAVWQILESTRDMLRGHVTQAIEEGWSNDRLAETIEQHHAFSEERAMVIARTETAIADVQGNLEAYSVSGQVDQKRWLTAPGCCDECHELDGQVVKLDALFVVEDGDDVSGPPLHPNCRCDVLPILIKLPEPPAAT